MSALSRGETPGPEASITKIVSANKLQNIGAFGMDSLDMAGMLETDDPEIQSFQNAWLGAPGLRIAGGTDEILKNIIAEECLDFLKMQEQIKECHTKTYLQVILGILTVNKITSLIDVWLVIISTNLSIPIPTQLQAAFHALMQLRNLHQMT